MLSEIGMDSSTGGTKAEITLFKLTLDAAPTEKTVETNLKMFVARSSETVASEDGREERGWVRGSSFEGGSVNSEASWRRISRRHSSFFEEVASSERTQG